MQIKCESIIYTQWYFILSYFCFILLASLVVFPPIPSLSVF